MLEGVRGTVGDAVEGEFVDEGWDEESVWWGGTVGESLVAIEEVEVGS